MPRNAQDRSLQMGKSDRKILRQYIERVLRRADGEHRPLQIGKGPSRYMEIVYSNALYELNNINNK